MVKPALLSYDRYQFLVDWRQRGIPPQSGDIRQAAQTAGVPLLNIVQAASWDPVVRVPTGDEMRYLVYTTLAYGCAGISYYVYCWPGHTGRDRLARRHADAALPRFEAAEPRVCGDCHGTSAFAFAGRVSYGNAAAGDRAVARRRPVPARSARAPMPYKNLMPVKGILLGFFGPAARAPTCQPTHVVVVNLDYRADVATTLVGPEGTKLEVFNRHQSHMVAGRGIPCMLNLPRGGGKLVRLTHQ